MTDTKLDLSQNLEEYEELSDLELEAIAGGKGGSKVLNGGVQRVGEESNILFGS